jgi:hypothetical protein
VQVAHPTLGYGFAQVLKELGSLTACLVVTSGNTGGSTPLSMYGQAAVKPAEVIKRSIQVAVMHGLDIPS